MSNAELLAVSNAELLAMSNAELRELREKLSAPRLRSGQALGNEPDETEPHAEAPSREATGAHPGSFAASAALREIAHLRHSDLLANS
jgi:hypothetical protein